MSTTLTETGLETQGVLNILRLDVDYSVTHLPGGQVLCEALDGQKVLSTLPCLTRLPAGTKFYLVAAAHITLGLRIR